MSRLLTPVVILIAWSMVMWAWMYATRIPAILKMRLRLDPKAARGEQMNLLPPEVRWKADNYNNLMEQPTVFYALVLVLVFLNDTSLMSLTLAWAYVVLRIIHSLVQALVNTINLRFSAFILSGVFLVVLTVRALTILF